MLGGLKSSLLKAEDTAQGIKHGAQEEAWSVDHQSPWKSQADMAATYDPSMEEAGAGGQERNHHGSPYTHTYTCRYSYVWDTHTQIINQNRYSKHYNHLALL